MSAYSSIENTLCEGPTQPPAYVRRRDENAIHLVIRRSGCLTRAFCRRTWHRVGPSHRVYHFSPPYTLTLFLLTGEQRTLSWLLATISGLPRYDVISPVSQMFLYRYSSGHPNLERSSGQIKTLKLEQAVNDWLGIEPLASTWQHSVAVFSSRTQVTRNLTIPPSCSDTMKLLLENTT
jgi:hypothetical protein